MAPRLRARAGGVLLLGEPVSTRLVGSGMLTLGGIAIAVASAQRSPAAQGVRAIKRRSAR